MMAACAAILAINIYERARERQAGGDFFAGCAGPDGQFAARLNTDIWNDRTVHDMTGYSITDLKSCLYDLALFVNLNLESGQLDGFDIEAIK